MKKKIQLETQSHLAFCTKGQVRLTENGTKFFRSIQGDKGKLDEFFEKLTLEMANAIPISPNRVTTNQRFQIDTEADPEQILLSINIEKDHTGGLERSIDDAATDLEI